MWQKQIGYVELIEPFVGRAFEYWSLETVIGRLVARQTSASCPVVEMPWRLQSLRTYP